ncbi:MAG: hypothetical protein ACREFD_02025 [Stellaceae bacterium]
MIPILVPIFVCVLDFIFVHPIFGYIIGNFLFILIPYTILVGYAIIHLRRRVVGVMLLGAIILGEIWGLHNYFLSPNPPIKQAAAIIEESLMPGDGIILAQNTAMRWGLAYYLRRDRSSPAGGLDVSSEWNYRKLIRTHAAAIRYNRDWVVLPTDQKSAVNLQFLTEEMHLIFKADLHNTIILLFRH